MRALWALTLAFHSSSCSSGSGLRSCDARLEISRSNSRSTVSTLCSSPRLRTNVCELQFAVTDKKEKPSRGGLGFARLIETGQSHTQEILTLAETARATDR